MSNTSKFPNNSPQVQRLFGEFALRKMFLLRLAIGRQCIESVMVATVPDYIQNIAAANRKIAVVCCNTHRYLQRFDRRFYRSQLNEPEIRNNLKFYSVFRAPNKFNLYITYSTHSIIKISGDNFCSLMNASHTAINFNDHQFINMELLRSFDFHKHFFAIVSHIRFKFEHLGHFIFRLEPELIA